MDNAINMTYENKQQNHSGCMQ